MNNSQITAEDLKGKLDKCTELYEFAPIAYFTFDLTGTILEISLTGAKQLGGEKSLFLQKAFIDYLLTESQEIFLEHLKQVAQEPGHHICELKVKHKENDFFYSKMESIVIADKKRCRSALLDITVQKQVELQLKRANQTKSEFLAIMSHELRTPLNAVLGLSELLQQGIYGNLSEKQVDPVRMIYQSGKNLLSLINDILEISKIEVEQIHVEFMPLSIQELGESSLAFIKEAAVQKNITTSFKHEDSITILLADRCRLKQILVSLLDNAIKFTPKGGKVGLEVITNEDMIDFIIWDTGIGIASKDLKRLFQPFTQLDSGLNRKYGGTGLGLYLVYRLAKLHHGNISVTSELDKGSRFTLTLPWQAIKEEQ